MGLKATKLVPAVLFAAAAILGGTAVGDPATACAESKGSQKAYDECVARGSNKRLCCSQASGQWTETKYYDKDGNYLYSTWDCAGLAMQKLQPTSPRGVATQTLEPAPPPVRQPGVLQTFTPAHIGRVG